MKHKERHPEDEAAGEMTVDAWFESWMKDVKPIDCQRILNRMEEMGYAGGTIKQTYVCLGTMMRTALFNIL